MSKASQHTLSHYIASAQRVIAAEKSAIEALEKQLDNNFAHACQLLIQCTGHIIVTGVGKSGHIGRKMAATLASTGSPAFFVHAGEANHGDMGMVTSHDVVIALSNSGKTAEVISLLPLLKRMGASIISITGDSESILAQKSDVHLFLGGGQEACPLGLAPTSSTTTTLVLGDALAIALLEARGFTQEEFALAHPGGTLGIRLLLKVDDIMHTGADLPCVPCGILLNKALLEISSKGLGMAAICDPEGKMVGIFTDGDLRRAIDQGIDPRVTPIDLLMTKQYTTVQCGLLAAEALNIMQKKRINGLFCVDNYGHPVGAFNMTNLVNARVL